MEYLKQFKGHISHNDLPSFVSLWEEYCLCDEIDTAELIYILEAVQDSTFADSFGIYVDQILPLWETLPDTPERHTIFRLMIDIQTTNSPKLAEKVYLYIHDRYENTPEFANKLRLVGLREKDNFRKAISNFELLNHLKPHNFVFHTGGWGVGEIVDVSFIREEISLEFDYVAGLKDISFKNGFNTLIPISDDHFLARRFGDPDQLEKDAKKDPVAVLKTLLKDLGPKTAGEIKDELCDLVIPEDEWAKWWQGARNKLKKDTLVESPKKLKEPFQLRQSELTHEQQLQKILDKKPDVNNLIEILYSFIRDFPSALKKAEFKSTLILHLSDMRQHKEVNQAQELQLLFFLSDLNSNQEEGEISEIIKRASSLVEITQNIEIVAFKKRFLSLVMKYRDDWHQLFLELFLMNIQNPTRDYILQQLLKAGKRDEVIAKIEEMLSHPHQSPHAFLWYFGKIMDNHELPFSDADGKNRFLENFFVLLYLVERDLNDRDLAKKMHNFMTADRYSMVRKIFENAPIEVVKEILLLSTKCQALDEHDLKILQSLAAVVHADLNKVEEEGEESEEKVIWTTEEGYIKIKDRLHQIATVETVQNAKEIEVARAHGDLRENAEFKYALEKRSQLQAEMKLLSDQIAQMQVITSEDIETTAIGIGTVALMEDQAGTVANYTFLGPWDTDPDNNILSFHSKFAQALVGAQVGDTRKIQDIEWTIREIKSYLEK